MEVVALLAGGGGSIASGGGNSTAAGGDGSTAAGGSSSTAAVSEVGLYPTPHSLVKTTMAAYNEV